MSETHTRRDDTLLTPEFMHQLDRLDVMSRKILTGKLQGERRSKKKGQSVEFADYRNYVVGDDLRFIDWNLYARLDKLFLRLFMEEEDLAVSVAIDITGSMDYGEPNKLMYAKRLAAALGYIGLVNYNRVSLFSFTDTVVDQLPGLRGRRPVPRMLDFLQQQQIAKPQTTPGSAGNLETVCKRLALLQRQPGIVILVSDFFDKGELGDALRYLASDRYDTYALQLLSPQELDPVKGQVVGDLRLKDVEDGDIAEVSITPALVKRYKANLQAYCQHVRDQCLRRGIAYLMSDTSVPFETVVLKYLRQRGLVG
ncbi:DUF58 domain-containing protein [Phycisphaerales bacterium AB-hyl4]|uniref:DUF58 domain-containing protein n=1 Tax=Natronomicrosphaera hydrolytica TaxID=3242702 RepID=A0ABV4U301_9BACT